MRTSRRPDDDFTPTRPDGLDGPAELPTLALDDALMELAYSKDWSPASADWYRVRLNAFAAYAKQAGVTNVAGITAPLVRRFIDHVRNTPTPKGTPKDSHTVHGYVRAVRTLLNWAASEGLLDERLPKRIALPHKEQKVLRILDDEQLALLFGQAKRSPAPLRDTALLALLVDTGCRASELCGLRLEDVTFTPDAAWILVHGKGRKQREIGMGKRARMALHRYISRERRATATERHVFLARNSKPLKPEGLDRMLYRLRDAVGRERFEGVSVGAHRFRHLSAVKALEGGMDVYALSRRLGHADIGVTTGYLRAVSQRSLRSLDISPLDRLGL